MDIPIFYSKKTVASQSRKACCYKGKKKCGSYKNVVENENKGKSQNLCHALEICHSSKPKAYAMPELSQKGDVNVFLILYLSIMFQSTCLLSPFSPCNSTQHTWLLLYVLLKWTFLTFKFILKPSWTNVDLWNYG